MQKRRKFNTSRGLITALASALSLQCALPSPVNARNIENENPPVSARSGGPADRYWVDFGVGANRLGPGVLIGFSRLHEGNQWTVRFSHMEVFQFCIFGPCQEPAADNNSLGMQFGRTAHFSHGFLSMTVGPGLHWGTDHNGVSFLTGGAAAQAEAFVTSSVVGVGIVAYADMNPVQGILPGGVLALRFGSLGKARP